MDRRGNRRLRPDPGALWAQCPGSPRPNTAGARSVVQGAEPHAIDRPHNMPKIVEEVYYDGARERIERLGLTPLVAAIRFANGVATVSKLIDEPFDRIGGWAKKVSGDRIGSSQGCKWNQSIQRRQGAGVGKKRSSGYGHDPSECCIPGGTY